jgi:hypothetical protein
MRGPGYILAIGSFAVIFLGSGIYALVRRRHRRRGRSSGAANGAGDCLSSPFLSSSRAIAWGANWISGRAATVECGRRVAAALAVAGYRAGAIPAAEARATTGILQIAFAILVVGTSAGLIAAAIRLRGPRPKARPASEMPTLAATVESALAGLNSGRDATGVVAECYREMMRAFAASSGVDPPLRRGIVRALDDGLGEASGTTSLVSWCATASATTTFWRRARFMACSRSPARGAQPPHDRSPPALCRRRRPRPSVPLRAARRGGASL